MKFSLPLRTLRYLSVLLMLVYAAALYMEWTLPLSSEAEQYQLEYPDTIRSGVSYLYLVSKVAWIAGTCSGVIGVTLILSSAKRGLVPIALSAPFIAWGAYLQAPESNYPSVEPMLALLLWCASSAIWAAVVTLAWLRNGEAFNADSKQLKGSRQA